MSTHKPSKIKQLYWDWRGWAIHRWRRLRGTVSGSVDNFFQFGCRNEQWVRVIMNRETASLVRGLNPGNIRALELSGDQWREFGFKSYSATRFPTGTRCETGTIESDICAEPVKGEFDLVIAEQVFEHLLWPYRAGKNVYESLKKGGHFLVTTPFMIRVHDDPVDCTRWTETGIRHFLAECGFPMDQIRTGSWGNRQCVKANFSRWQRYRPGFHSLRNEKLFPVSVWALAKKI